MSALACALSAPSLGRAQPPAPVEDTDPGVEPAGEPAEAAPEELTEEERSERARALFGEGVQHSQEERWDEAAAAFEAALELRTAPPIRYNLAAAYVELGRYRDARAQLEAVEADPETSPDIARLSEELASRVRAEAGRLSVERSVDLADTEVALDAETLDAAWLDREIPVAPGPHVVTASRDGASVARAEVSVGAGEHTHVYLGLGARPDDPDDEQPTPLYEEWAFWVAIGAGVVVVGALVGIIAATSSGGGSSELVEGNFMPGVFTWP